MALNTATGTDPSTRGSGAKTRPVRALRVNLSTSLGAGGFTIIELLIVMTLIIILASIGMVQYRTSVTRAQEAVLKENLFRMRDAMDQFHADKNKWPSDLSELVSEGYIREVPIDPFTQSKDTWQTTAASTDASNPAASGGIDQVHSGAEQTALDGSRYADWN